MTGKKLNHVVQLLKSDRESVEEKLSQQLDRLRKYEKEVEKLKALEKRINNDTQKRVKRCKALLKNFRRQMESDPVER